VLPAVISTDGAWAGETVCTFSNKKQTENRLERRREMLEPEGTLDG
jgi:hypothetical protein